MNNMEYFIYIQGNSKVRWRGWELQEEGEREKEQREKKEKRARAHTVRFTEKTEEESEQNIRVVDEICIYYNVYRKLNKLATVGGNNVQLLIF